MPPIDGYHRESRRRERVGNERARYPAAYDSDVAAPVLVQRRWYLADSVAKEPECVRRSEIQGLLLPVGEASQRFQSLAVSDPRLGHRFA